MSSAVSTTSRMRIWPPHLRQRVDGRRVRGAIDLGLEQGVHAALRAELGVGRVPGGEGPRSASVSSGRVATVRSGVRAAAAGRRHRAARRRRPCMRGRRAWRRRRGPGWCERPARRSYRLVVDGRAFEVCRDRPGVSGRGVDAHAGRARPGARYHRDRRPIALDHGGAQQLVSLCQDRHRGGDAVRVEGAEQPPRRGAMKHGRGAVQGEQRPQPLLLARRGDLGGAVGHDRGAHRASCAAAASASRESSSTGAIARVSRLTKKPGRVGRAGALATWLYV